MAPSRRVAAIAVLVAIGLIVPACGSFAPPESCGEWIGGTADEARFAQHFTEMHLVSEATGRPGPEDPEAGIQVTATERVAVEAATLADVTVWTCVQERRGGGKIAFNQEHRAAQGGARLSLGSFKSGSYVVRVIVDGTLLKNLTFLVK